MAASLQLLRTLLRDKTHLDGRGGESVSTGRGETSQARWEDRALSGNVPGLPGPAGEAQGPAGRRGTALLWGSRKQPHPPATRSAPVGPKAGRRPPTSDSQAAADALGFREAVLRTVRRQAWPPFWVRRTSLEGTRAHACACTHTRESEGNSKQRWDGASAPGHTAGPGNQRARDLGHQPPPQPLPEEADVKAHGRRTHAGRDAARERDAGRARGPIRQAWDPPDPARSPLRVGRLHQHPARRPVFQELPLNSGDISHFAFTYSF